MTTALRLSNILGRGVSLEWFEAVALVREVADRVRDSVGGRAVPELDQVQLAADGTVSITGTAKDDEPVRRLGQLLQACLVQSDPPVQLRLVAAQATSPDPTFNSIRDYSQALAYFERPDRSGVLRTLYEKAQSASESFVDSGPTLDAIAPLQSAEAVAKREKAAIARRPRSARAVLAIATVVAVVAGVTVYSQLNRSALVGGDVTALAVKTSDAVGTTLVKGLSAVSETVGLGRLVPADGSSTSAATPVVPPAATPVEKPVESRKRTATPTRSQSQTTVPFRAFDLAVLPPGIEIPAAVTAAKVNLGTPFATPLLGTNAGEATVYSAEDSTVVPPVGVRPQLPRVLPNDIRKEQLSQIELVVLPDGTVGSVKLLGFNRGVLDGMLLSAAKAWTFKPAEKDGRPVTYRKTVWLVRE